MEPEESKLVQKLNDQLTDLAIENEGLQDQLQQFLEDDEISSFQDRQYTDEVREVYYSFIAKGVSIRNVESVIRMVLRKLTNRDIGRLPQKSLTAEMMYECNELAKMQVEKVLLEDKNSTLHLDGT